MKITEILKVKDKAVSFEFFPPKSEKGRQSLSATVDILKTYNPLYASMTYGAGGTTQQRTKEAVSMLLEKKTLEVMPHLTCIGAKAAEVRDILDGYKHLGIENIMALRGDPPQGLSGSDFSARDFLWAKDLVKTIKEYGHFCIGVAVYPEGHIETDSLELDLEYTKQKIDSGADFAVTQMFFDNKYFYSLLERMRKAKINLPVLPGILPLTDVEKVKQFASVCRTTIPEYIEQTMQRYRHQPEDMEKAGIDFTIKQCSDLIANGIKRIHFFTLNKPKVITTILKGIG